jgi:hypothetical protein
VKTSIPDDVVYETVDEQVVLLSLSGGTYYKLNGSGSRIWTLIGELGDLGKVTDAMVTEYDAEPEQIRRDVATLVEDLKAHGLVRAETSMSG